MSNRKSKSARTGEFAFGRGSQIPQACGISNLPKETKPMPTNRTPITHAPRRQITAEMVALFQRCRQMRVERSDLRWEPEGKRGEYIEAATMLHRLLGGKPWMLSVLDAGRKPLETDARVLADWKRARTLRRQLIAAARTSS
jgi:hypothetical protein